MDRDPIDRRAFLAGLGGSTLLLAGCGSALADPPRRPRGSTAPRHLRSRPRTLQASIRGHVFRPGQPGYAQAARVYNTRYDGAHPQAVARPLDGTDVRDAVRWALSTGTHVRARSGGHSYAGYSTLSDGVVFDLRGLNAVTLDRRTGTATVGPGAQLIDLYAALAAHGATIPGGSCPSVGVGGVTLGGGMGLAGRAFGLTTDHLLAAEIVLPDGELHTVDARHDPDLLWALKGGGGGNFGIVTSFTFRTQRVPPTAVFFHVAFPWSRAAEALDAWLRWAPDADDRLTSSFDLIGAAGVPTASIIGQYLGPAEDLGRLLTPMRQAGGTIFSADAGYLDLQLRFAGCESTTFAACHTVGTYPGATLTRDSFEAKSDYLDRPLSAAALSIVTAAIEQRAQAPGNGSILFDAYGGQVNRVAPTATAFVHRTQLCGVQYLSYDGDDTWLTDVHARMRPHVSGEAYQNYIDPALADWPTAYYGRNLPRLRATRRRVDPHRFFAFPQGID